MESQRTTNSQNNLEQNKAECTTLPDFRLCYKATVIKTTESLEIHPCLYGQSMTKGAGIYNKEMTASSKSGARENWTDHAKRKEKEEIRPLSYTIYKNKLKMD